MPRSTFAYAVPFALSLTLLIGCNALRTHQARDPQGQLVGANVLDLVPMPRST